MMDDMVTVTNIQDGQIFQQVNGFADIPVEGYFHMTPQPDREDHHIVLMLYREHNYTLVGEPVAADWNGDTFRAVLPHVPAGGPYVLQTSFVPLYNVDWGIRGEAKFHLGVGDLYVIAGQSNSAGYGKTPFEDAPCEGVRLLRNRGDWMQAAHPLNETADAKKPNTEGCVTGSSPWLRFAKTLHSELHYPIGLIQTSLGGTALASWNPKENGYLYRNMLTCIREAGGRIAGVLWYQGCNETNTAADAEGYLTRFGEMVAALREDLNAPTLPFLTVQLNRAIRRDGQRSEGWAPVCEAQRQAARTIPHVYVTPSLDLPLSDSIHNNSAANAVLGERTGYLALEKIYGKAYFGQAPDVRSAVRHTDGTVTVTFDGVRSFIEMHQIAPHNLEFYFEDAGGEYGVKDYAVQGASLRLTPQRAPQGAMTVSFSPYNDHYAVPPIDRATGQPPLAFYRFPVVDKDD